MQNQIKMLWVQCLVKEFNMDGWWSVKKILPNGRFLLTYSRGKNVMVEARTTRHICLGNLWNPDIKK